MLQRKLDKVIEEHYPEATDAKDTSIKYLGEMKTKHDIDISKVLMACSVCSDDVNSTSLSFFNILFGPFILGGLAGMPYTGVTGLTAFSHHIPDQGTAFIFYGPHIGLTLDGEVGLLQRPRLEKAGSCCGALILALSRLKDESYKPDLTNEDDYQQMYLESCLSEHRKQIFNAEDQIKEATEVIFKEIDQRLHRQLKATKNEFKCEKIALLGGIIINTDYGLDDYFAPRNYEVLKVSDL
jgi:hypothetical protein